MELGKVPPHDDEAEQAVLGSMLTDKDAVVAAIETLKPGDFYRNDNMTIYEAVMTIYGKGEPIDIITLKDELTSMGKLEAVGGLEYLASLPDKVPTTANVDKYVKMRYNRRNLHRSSRIIKKNGRRTHELFGFKA